MIAHSNGACSSSHSIRSFCMLIRLRSTPPTQQFQHHAHKSRMQGWGRTSSESVDATCRPPSPDGFNGWISQTDPHFCVSMFSPKLLEVSGGSGFHPGHPGRHPPAYPAIGPSYASFWSHSSPMNGCSWKRKGRLGDRKRPGYSKPAWSLPTCPSSQAGGPHCLEARLSARAAVICKAAEVSAQVDPRG